MISNALEGKTILDCSSLLPGPFVGKLLAELGARVIKIESPVRRDPGMKMAGGAFYEDLNSLKELVLQDWSTPDGRAQFEALVRNADGLIEAFRPATKRKWGLEPKRLHQLNPKLCIASLRGYPEASPWAERAGHNLNFEAVSGVLTLFKEMPPLPLADLLGAYDAALRLAAALGTGDGAVISVSLEESLRRVQSGLGLEFRRTGHAPLPGEHLFSGAYPCYRLYRDRDGRRIAVGAIEHKYWIQVLEILGLKELEGDAYARGKEAERVAGLVQEKLGKKPWREWAPVFEAADCCVDGERTYEEVFGA